MDDELRLSKTLRALARAEAHDETPPHVETSVMARWDAAHAPRSSMQVFGRGAAAAGLLLAVLGAAALQRGFSAGDPPTAPPSPRQTARLAASAVAPADMSDARVATISFPSPAPRTPGAEPRTIVLVGEPIAAGEPLNVVRMRVARSMLAALGMSEATQEDSVDIDVLVGDDGVARALRVEM